MRPLSTEEEGTAERGIGLTALGTLVYLLAAVVASAGVGVLNLLGGTPSTRNPPGPAPAGIATAQVILTILPLVLASISLALISLGLYRTWRRMASQSAQTPLEVMLARGAHLLGLFVLAAAIIIVLAGVAGVAGLENQIAFGYTAGAAACLLFLSLAITGAGFAGRAKDRKTLTSLILASSLAGPGVVGEVMVTINYWVIGPEWLTYPGLPLLNLSLLFGAFVAVSTFFLWYALRSLRLNPAIYRRLVREGTLHESSQPSSPQEENQVAGGDPPSY